MKKLICGFTALLLGATGAVCHAQTGVPDFSWYGDGTASEFYIGTADQLAALCSLSNGFESGSEPIHFYGKTIHLTADIDLSCYGKNYNFRDGEGWYPIGDSGTTCFHAVFDGNGKTIKNLYMNRTSPSLENVGFFGFIGSGGVVKNLTFENVDISNTLPTNNYSVEMGTVAGYFKGNEITDCVVTGNIKGCNYTGGFTGSVCGGTISNCYFKGVIEAPSAGGISGLVQMGKIVNCFTNDILMPFISLLTGRTSFENMFLVLRPGENGESVFNTLEEATAAGATIVAYGNLIQLVLDFILTALVLFLVVKGMNKLREAGEKVKNKEAEEKKSE